MKAPEGWVIGWKAIADRLGVAESTARAYCHRQHDPLRVIRRASARDVGLPADDLDAWAARQWVSVAASTH